MKLTTLVTPQTPIQNLITKYFYSKLHIKALICYLYIKKQILNKYEKIIIK
jgi:hypothetical protein